MVERRVINKQALINKLNGMLSENISELQMNSIFVTLGQTIQIEEEGDAKNAVQTD